MLCWMFDALETRGPKNQNHETFHRSEASLQNFSLTYHGISRPFYFMKLELHFIPCSLGLFLVDGFNLPLLTLIG